MRYCLVEQEWRETNLRNPNYQRKRINNAENLKGILLKYAENLKEINLVYAEILKTY